MIQVRSLRKTFGKQLVLDNVSFNIADGGTTAIVGPSGTGKSVLLKIITGLLEADSGEVVVNGQSMTQAGNAEARRKICSRMGVLFQAAALFDSISVFENVAFPLRERKVCGETEITSRSLECLENVGLRGYERAFPGEISIGMRKRVGIARALVTKPDVILFDEPNTGLDPQVGQEIYELIAETQKLSGFTGIVVSHEIPEVFQVCDKVIMLYQGKVQHDGSVKDFLASDNPVVRQFVAGSVEGPIEMS